MLSLKDGLIYNAENPSFEDYVMFHKRNVPRAIAGVIDMLTFGHGSIWVKGDEKFCKYQDYFDHILSMSMIIRCKIRYYGNEKCSLKELERFKEHKRVIGELFEEHCSGRVAVNYLCTL